MTIFNNPNLDNIFSALRHQSRREIISMLSDGQSKTVNEIVKQFSASQPTISKHLTILEDAKLIKREVRGRAHYFTASVEGFDLAQDWLTRHRNWWNKSLDRLEIALDHPKESK